MAHAEGRERRRPAGRRGEPGPREQRPRRALVRRQVGLTTRLSRSLANPSQPSSLPYNFNNCARHATAGWSDANLPCTSSGNPPLNHSSNPSLLASCAGPTPLSLCGPWLFRTHHLPRPRQSPPTFFRPSFKPKMLQTPSLS